MILVYLVFLLILVNLKIGESADSEESDDTVKCDDSGDFVHSDDLSEYGDTGDPGE